MQIIRQILMKYLKRIDELTLYHGTNVSFDCFDIEKINTGYGGASYGYGLYFTSKSDLADFYATKMQYKHIDFDKMSNLIINKICKDLDYDKSSLLYLKRGIESYLADDAHLDKYLAQFKENAPLIKDIILKYKKKYYLKNKYIYSIELDKPFDELKFIYWTDAVTGDLREKILSKYFNLTHNTYAKSLEDKEGKYDRNFTKGEYYDISIMHLEDVAYDIQEVKYEVNENILTSYEVLHRELVDLYVRELREYSNSNKANKKISEDMQDMGYDGIYAELKNGSDIYVIFNDKNIRITNVCKFNEYKHY